MTSKASSPLALSCSAMGPVACSGPATTIGTSRGSISLVVQANAVSITASRVVRPRTMARTVRVSLVVSPLPSLGVVVSSVVVLMSPPK